MEKARQGVPVVIPPDVWQPLMEVRSQLDSECPGAPTPVDEVLREVIDHYRRCEKTVEEADDFCRRAQKWKKTG